LFPVREESAGMDLRSIYDENASMLLRIALRITGTVEAAEDVVQDAFAKMVEKEMRFPGPNDAKYWLIRVVKNAALNHAKRKGREARAYEKWWRIGVIPVEQVEAGAFHVAGTGAEAGVQAAVEEEFLRSETAGEMREALEKLPEKLKMVLVLKEYGDMNYKEIGKVLGITEGNVKVRAFRAREALLARFREKNRNVP
jgi:RNA polymerase sigma factor (sigma-70 family)